VSVVVLSVLLGLHLLGGFHNPIVIRDVVLSNGALAASLGLGFVHFDPHWTPVFRGLGADQPAALLFGLAHAAGGWRYVLLATLAGTGYGLAYRRTVRIESAILAHFAVNVTHLLLFTYPALA
jgi:hypothetical protein